MAIKRLQSITIVSVLNIAYFAGCSAVSQKADVQSQTGNNILCRRSSALSMSLETYIPDGLVCELLRRPQKTVITDSRPEFGWTVNSPVNGDYQSAYQILVASSIKKLKNNTGDMWDSGRVSSRQSTNVTYDGRALSSNTSYFWKVRTCNSAGTVSPYSLPQTFHTGQLTDKHSVSCYRLEQETRPPVVLKNTGEGCYFIDFGKAAFATVRLTIDCDEPNRIMQVHLGEVIKGENQIDREPGKSRRYRKMSLPLKKGLSTYTVEVQPPKNKRNVTGAAILMPEYIGEVMPFRYCELENCPCVLSADMVQQLTAYYPFDENASYFHSSSAVLNDVWRLCKYSIKATSFAGYYVDGDRERIPYEADAYLNQLSHYCCDSEYSIGRRTHEYLITHPTWPTEWQLHSVLMAWADYLYSGDSESI